MVLPSPGIRTGREAGSIFCFQSDFTSFQRETLAYQYFLGSLFFHLSGLASLSESKCTKKGTRKRENTGKKKKKAWLGKGKQKQKDCQELNLQRKFFWKLKTCTDWRDARKWLKGVENGSHLHQVIASLAADDEIVLISIHRLQVSDDSKLIQWDRLRAPYFC